MKRWFGPKLFGWGAGPASWEGWLATGLLVAAVGLLTRVPGLGQTGLLIGAGVLLAIYLVVAALTYGPRSARTEGGEGRPWGPLAAVWTAYLLATAAVSAWGWGRLAAGPLPIHWDAGGVADRFAPGERVLLAAPAAVLIVVVAVAVLTGGRARSGALPASLAALTLILLLHLAYVAAHLGVLT